MITIFSRIAIRFSNPSVNLLSKPRPNESPEETAKRVAADSSNLDRPRQKNQPLYFETIPGEVQSAPDWIAEGPDNAWLWEKHGQDGNIMKVQSEVPISQDAEVKRAEKSLEQSAAQNEDTAANDEDTEGQGIFDESNSQKEQNDSARAVPPGAKRKKVTGN